jgi:hypothetical protein
MGQHVDGVEFGGMERMVAERWIALSSVLEA